MKRTVSSKVTVCGVKMSEHVVYLAQESCLFQRFRLESVSGQVSAKAQEKTFTHSSTSNQSYSGTTGGSMCTCFAGIP